MSNIFLQIDVLNKYLFLTSKPMIYLVNLSEKDYIRKKNKWLVGCFVCPVCYSFSNFEREE